MRTRNFSLIVYGNQDDIKLTIDYHKKNILHYAYILHDKDEVVPHYHVLLWLVNATTDSAVRQWFSDVTSQNVLSQQIVEKSAIVSYLTHKGIKDKYEYSWENIYTDDFMWLTKEEEISTSFESMFTDFDNGVPLYDMCKRYGRDFVINFQKYNDMYNMICNQRSRQQKKQLAEFYAEGNKQLLIDLPTGEILKQLIK